MKALMTLLAVLTMAPFTMARLSKEQIITYHVETLNWPDSLKPTIDQALQILTAPNQCWSYNSKTKISFAIELDSKKPCSAFIAYKDDTKLISAKKNLTDAKLLINYVTEKNGQMKLTLFKSDGKKLISAASTSFLFKKDETADSLKDVIVKWSLK